MQAQAQENKEYKPEYLIGVRWEVDEMPYYVEWQGIRLTFNGIDSTVDLRLPVSQYVKKGRNVFSLTSWPLEYTENQKMALSMIYWRPGEDPNNEAKTAFRVLMYPGRKPLGKPIIEYDPKSESPLRPLTDDIRFRPGKEIDVLTIVFENTLQMPTWSWEQGDVLKNDKKTRDSLTEVYRKMHALLEQKNNDAIMDLSSVMIEESALAYDQPTAYVRHRAGHTMEFKHPELFKLAPFPTKPMTLNLGADNRVAWLTTKGLSTPLYFDHIQAEDRATFITNYFIRKNGKWILCR